MFCFSPRDNTECVLCGRHIGIRGQGTVCLPRALDRKQQGIMTKSRDGTRGTFCRVCRDKNELRIARKTN